MPVVPWLVVVSVHVAGLALLSLSGPADVVSDAGEYWRLGSLCGAGDFTWRGDPIAYRTPGYPAFLGIFQHFAGDRAWQVTVACQHLLLIVTAATTAWIVWGMTDNRRWALAAYVVTAAGFVRSWYAQAVLTETLFTALVVVHFACLFGCLKKVTSGQCLAVGSTLAAAILVRPVVQFWWLPAFGLIVCGGEGATLASRIRRSLLGFAAMCALVVPWMYRNQTLFGEPFLTQFVGRNLWIVTFQGGAGAGLSLPTSDAADALLAQTGWQPGDPRLLHTWTVSDQLTAGGMPDDDVDRLMNRVCLDAIRADVAVFTVAAGRRLVNFWRCVPGPFPYLGDGTADPPPGQIGWSNQTLTRWERGASWLVLQQSVRWNEFVAVCVLAGTLVMMCRRETRRQGAALLMFFGMVSALTSLVEIPAVRYRLVLEPLMVVAVCCGADVLLRRRSSRESLEQDGFHSMGGSKSSTRKRHV